MTSKFWYLVSVSLKKKMKTKAFLIVNIILAIALIAVTNIDTIITFFGGDFNDTYQVLVLDDTGVLKEPFEQTLTDSSLSITDQSIEFIDVTGTYDEVKEEVKDNKKILIYFKPSDTNYLEANIVSDKKIDSIFYQSLVSSINLVKQSYALSLSDIDPVELASISETVNINRVVLATDSSSVDENMSLIMGTVFPTLILPFFMLVIFLVQMIGTEINEEKSTRSMEIIISNVSPKTHFFSKVFASNIFVLTQGLLLIVYGAIGLLTRNIISPNASLTTGIFAELGSMIDVLKTSGVLNNLIYIIPITLILMILSFIAYSLVAGILASMTVSMDDYQQIQGPVVMTCLVGYYLAIMAGMFKGALFIKILSFVPFISCLLAPALLVIGDITIIDALIAILILIALIFVLVKYGLKIYKVGILNYSTDKMWKKIFKAATAKDK